MRTECLFYLSICKTQHHFWLRSKITKCRKPQRHSVKRGFKNWRRSLKVHVFWIWGQIVAIVYYLKELSGSVLGVFTDGIALQPTLELANGHKNDHLELEWYPVVNRLMQWAVTIMLFFLKKKIHRENGNKAVHGQRRCRPKVSVNHTKFNDANILHNDAT